MSADEKLQGQSLADDQLAKTSGGRTKYHDVQNDKYYIFSSSFHTYDEQYLCPNCGQPLSSNFGIYYTCGACNESWFNEDKLVPNVANWSCVSKSEYDKNHGH